jgi:hypothetical protein
MLAMIMSQCLSEATTHYSESLLPSRRGDSRRFVARVTVGTVTPAVTVTVTSRSRPGYH